MVEQSRAKADAARLWSALVDAEVAVIQGEIAARAAAARTPRRRSNGQPAVRPHQGLPGPALTHLLAGRLVTGFEEQAARWHPPNGQGQVLTRLKAQVELRAQVGRRIERLVAESRAAGVSWAGIARALNVSRQSAHQRYAGRPVPSGPPAGDLVP